VCLLSRWGRWVCSCLRRRSVCRRGSVGDDRFSEFWNSLRLKLLASAWQTAFCLSRELILFLVISNQVINQVMFSLTSLFSSWPAKAFFLDSIMFQPLISPNWLAVTSKRSSVWPNTPLIPFASQRFSLSILDFQISPPSPATSLVLYDAVTQSHCPADLCSLLFISDPK
jgi:hypothetical protein